MRRLKKDWVGVVAEVLVSDEVVIVGVEEGGIGVGEVERDELVD